MSKGTFERTGFFSRGYDPDEVDSFLEDAKEAYSAPSVGGIDEDAVRNAVFGRKRNGYRTDQVDSALERLEVAFIQSRRADVIQAQGESAWLNDIYDKAKSLYPRLLRPAGERFADADGYGYAKDEVDALVDRLADYFDGKASVTSSDIHDVTFTDAKGAKAYNEGVVDVFLERAVTILVAVE